ncbi:conserved virulence factor C family protein [Bacillus atrophaeus]|uniref:conserved virulence factor C family protein n=4 Tax=Bacillus atrophaeus TaxID=1452 RepID=UPI00227EACD0|nr:conserved virulence factor C family protein [Bacillus atrophaeus]MCY8811401.1 conserved virulence factor C family protein [Bacillus atrophaeus]MCY8819975.1 conserved virulence factor C family protein [Bacillus atrophaeus]MCY8831222.1 conserved virulence factor C family protein [Bacillus atrophaeus]MCY8835425.1 conserved virulence factor C family protein [Bacillus atrophaeus]MEC0751213.1 conserved virulence factor C family protein [Bacillus atrophaeus]
MKIKSIEPTPSPNTMKVILTEELPAGKSNNYKPDQTEGAPPVVAEILKIEGVKGVYHVADFLAVERNARYDWKDILPQVRSAFGMENTESTESRSDQESFGEVKVFVQMFSGIPMQVKLSDGEREERFGLPERFQQAILKLRSEASNVVFERTWKEQGVRFGDFTEIGHDVTEELQAAYSDERLQRLTEAAAEGKGEEKQAVQRKSYRVTLEMLDDEDWKQRYAHLEQMDPKEEDIPVLAKALDDPKTSIRRQAIVYLGMIESSDVLPLLYKGLEDKTVTVRRTAGDCLSDIGDPKAIPAMIKSLSDSSKIVRWRAAMFLYEVGDESAVEALKAAEDDPEFEVSLQVKMAIERIEHGEEAKGSVWKQMTESRKKEQS